MDKTLEGLGVEYAVHVLSDELPNKVGEIANDAEVVFLFPTLDENKSVQVSSCLKAFAKAGMPVFSLLSSPALELGGYAAFDTEGNLDRIPRRVALKILEGQDAANIPVEMDHFTEDLIINMATAKTSRHYPSWDIMAEAVLMNVSSTDENARQLNLHAAITEGLENNLNIKTKFQIMFTKKVNL